MIGFRTVLEDRMQIGLDGILSEVLGGEAAGKQAIDALHQVIGYHFNLKIITTELSSYEVSF